MAADRSAHRGAADLASAVASGARIVGVIWPFLLAIVFLCALSYFGNAAMTAVRAYIGGESRWSKGQKDAYFHLDRYGQTYAEADFDAYLRAIAIPLGDHAAREALEQALPDPDAARAGFLTGGNDPADVPRLIWLFRYFRDIDGFARAIAIWREADAGIARMTRAADTLHLAVANHASPADMRHILDDVGAINAQLAPLEVAFSSTLGEASRRFERMLDTVLSALALVMLVLGALLSRRELRRRENAVDALRASEQRYALAAEGANDGIWDYDGVNRRVFYSQRVRDMLGYDESVLGPDPADLARVIAPEDYPDARAAVYRHWAERNTGILIYRMRMRTADNRVLWVLARSKTIYSADGAPLRMAGSYTDITEQVETELQLRLAGIVFDSSHQGILVVNAQREVVSVNRAFTELSGYGSNELVGKSIAELRSPAATPESYEQAWQAVQAHGQWRGESIARSKNGQDRPVELSIVRVPDTRNATMYYVYSGSDISERQYAAARIRHLAYIDVLTGLPNRSFANGHFETLIASSRGLRQSLAVVFVDLDGFKEVNDALGHAAGDRVIVEQAQRLRSGLQEGDVLCRYGGDEFLLLLPGRSGAQAAEIAAGLIARVAQRIALGSREITITASAGVSVFPSDAGDAETLIRAADTALYRAKARGKNTVVQFRMDMDRAVARRFDLISALRDAAERNQFELRFQPIVDTVTRAIVGAEALVYWNNPSLGLIGPSTFIGLAEESGLIESLGAWVIDEALGHYGEWMQCGLPPLYLSINLSTLQLRAPRLFQKKLDAAIQGGRIAANRVMLELTERQIVHDEPSSLPVLKALADQGVGVAIDDFGTGYSGLSYLKNLPVTQIKIDMAFIRNLATDRGDRAIVKSIIDLARSLRLSVVAEGVETEEQLALLREYGCPSVQGFLFAVPLSSPAFIAYVQNRHPPAPDLASLAAPALPAQA